MTQNDPHAKFENLFPGNLFANDFLCETILNIGDWKALDNSALDVVDITFQLIFEFSPIGGLPINKLQNLNFSF